VVDWIETLVLGKRFRSIAGAVFLFFSQSGRGAALQREYTVGVEALRAFLVSGCSCGFPANLCDVEMSSKRVRFVLTEIKDLTKFFKTAQKVSVVGKDRIQ